MNEDTVKMVVEDGSFNDQQAIEMNLSCCVALDRHKSFDFPLGDGSKKHLEDLSNEGTVAFIQQAMASISGIESIDVKPYILTVKIGAAFDRAEKQKEIFSLLKLVLPEDAKELLVNDNVVGKNYYTDREGNYLRDFERMEEPH